MRIFYVAQRVPFPPDRGDKITTFNEVRHLAQQHEVHVFCLADGKADLGNVPGLLKYAASVTAVLCDKWRSRARALRALAGGQPLSVAAFDEPALHRAIAQKYRELPPDLIIVYSCNVAQFAAPFRDVPRIMQFADLDSLKWGQYAQSAPPHLRWLYALEQRRLFEYERRIATTFDHSLVCTEIERGDFERLIPGAPISVVGNGVDLEYFHPSNQPKNPAAILFTGVMDYFPNVDAVVWFCDAILPKIRQQEPQAEMIICGSRPSSAVRRLARLPGVTVTGWVADTRPYLGAAEVFVAPLRLARGIQNKLLEAMAMGLPVVTTMRAWRGTALGNGDGIVATDDAESFADQVVRLLQDAGYREEMGQRARAAVEAQYRWDDQLKCLDDVIAAVSGGNA